MSQIIDPSDVEYNAFMQKVFNLLKDPCMNGISQDTRQHLDRIIEIAKKESGETPYTFIVNLQKAVPISYQMGGQVSRISKIHMAAELYASKANKKRDNMKKTLKEQQKLMEE